MQKGSKKAVYIQSLPLQQDEQSTFYQHQMALRKDLAKELGRRGVTIVEELRGGPAPKVLLLFQPVGRVGDELPAALENLDPRMRNQVVAVAVIQDDEYRQTEKDVLPPDFQDWYVLDLCVVPGTSRLKECEANTKVLQAMAQYATVDVGETQMDADSAGQMEPTPSSQSAQTAEVNTNPCKKK